MKEFIVVENGGNNCGKDSIRDKKSWKEQRRTICLLPGVIKSTYKLKKVKKQPIGILDSGWGGLSITREVVKLLPNESIVYFADSKNCPYGEKSLNEVRRITTKVIEFLIKKDCKIIVVACNSITSVLINELRSSYKIPFIGVEPATLIAAKKTRKGKIGVLATKTTAESRLFRATKNKISPKIEVEIEIGKGLVELVEKGIVKGKDASRVVLNNLLKFKEKDVDQVVLGCTHYPFLVEIMKKVAPEINFIDASFPVALQVKRVLEKEQLLNEDKQHFYDVYFSKKVGGMEILLEKGNLTQTREKELVIL